MKKILISVYCFLHGHDTINLYHMDNGRSAFGTHKCLRCGKEEYWQYDYSY